MRERASECACGRAGARSLSTSPLFHNADPSIIQTSLPPLTPPVPLPPRERLRARDYINWLLAQRLGPVTVNILDRDDVTCVEIPRDSVGFITGQCHATTTIAHHRAPSCAIARHLYHAPPPPNTPAPPTLSPSSLSLYLSLSLPRLMSPPPPGYRGESLRQIEQQSGSFLFTNGTDGHTRGTSDTETLLVFSHDVYNRKKVGGVDPPLAPLALASSPSPSSPLPTLTLPPSPSPRPPSQP